MNWTDLVQAIAAAGGVVVALLGFAALYYQIRQVRQAIQAESHGRIYQHALEVQKLLVENPKLRRILYDREQFDAETEVGEQVLALAELMADYLEHIMLQRPHVPVEVQEAWDNYTQDSLDSSPALRQILREHEHVYCRSFIARCREMATSGVRNSRPVKPGVSDAT